jgi:hypothetical protein
MADYSIILPDDGALQMLLSDTLGGPGYTPYNRAELVICDGGVSIGSRTCYGGDGTPMDRWHGIELSYDLAPNADAAWLRDQLSEGGEASRLIERVIAGHSERWNGSNTVGALDDDAEEASYSLMTLLADARQSDVSPWTAADWLIADGRAADVELDDADTAEGLVSTARRDGVLIVDGIDGMREAMERVRQARADRALELAEES